MVVPLMLMSILSILASCCFIPNIINSVLSPFSFSMFKFIQIWLSLTHFWSHFRHASWASLLFLIGVNDKYTCWSSAYSWNSIPCVLQMSPKGLVYNGNRMGPRTLPCGTQKVRLTGSDVAPSRSRFSIATHCVLFDRYESIHARAVPSMPKHLCRQSSKMVWSTVSKAADRSNRSR